jgi:hypothetical protein
VLAECKLWRNPEARREVIAQVLDYNRCLAGWRYADLETAVSRGLLPDGSRPQGGPWESMAAHAELDEAAFVDAVSRNLRLGRFLWLIVGDGIREGVEALASALQSHAGHHFTLALVELGVFALPDGRGWIVQPRVPARTLILRWSPEGGPPFNLGYVQTKPPVRVSA